MPFFYLSFCDMALPEGQQFLGATIVECEHAHGAVSEAGRRGVNPGGVAYVYFLKVTKAEELGDVAGPYLNAFVTRDQIMGSGDVVYAREAGVAPASVTCQDCNPRVFAS